MPLPSALTLERMASDGIIMTTTPGSIGDADDATAAVDAATATATTEISELDSLASSLRDDSSTADLSANVNDELQGLEAEAEARPAKRRRTGCHVDLANGGLVYPKSLYQGYKPPLPLVPEGRALVDLDAAWVAAGRAGEEYKIWHLDHFSIYRTAQSDFRRANELTPLHHLNVERGNDELLCDGILGIGGKRRHVQGISFSTMTVEGYGHDGPTAAVTICIQSRQGRRADVWYQLDTPAPEYKRYYRPFIWIARLGKYFVDFLNDNDKVTLNHFRNTFYNALCNRYSSSDDKLQNFLSQYGSQDFRQAVNAYAGYLWNQCFNLNQELCKHPVWAETLALNAIPETPYEPEAKTVVTPFVFDLYKNMPFACKLQSVETLDVAVVNARRARRKQLNLTPLDCQPTLAPLLKPTSAPSQRPKSADRLDIRKGDVVCLPPEQGTGWKVSDKTEWYAYVQDIRTTSNGVDGRKLDIIWLYAPSDTTLGSGYYPYKNELFMSDNCACGEEAYEVDDVICKVKVAWYSTNPVAHDGCFFVRQTYRTSRDTGAYDFRELAPSHFRCPCRTKQCDWDDLMASYHPGDAVLVRQLRPTPSEQEQGQDDDFLEPAQLIGFLPQPRKVLLRRLLRHPHGKPNQLTFTDIVYAEVPFNIIRKCYIRLFPDIKSVDSPYHRNGAGDFYFIVTPHDDPAISFPPLRQGDYPRDRIPPAKRMKGLTIFSGGGSFDRGLEEGGAVDFTHVVELKSEAMHTYRANLDHPDQAQLFLGSVNDYLAGACHGHKDDRIGKIGEIDFVAGGSPCPGYSILQQDKHSDQSLRNCSLVCSIVTAVDFYMPLGMVLENVRGIAATPKEHPEHNVFSQTLCSLVALGYQVKQFLMDPSGYGSCQSRQRVFIVATAPGCVPPDRPPQTHSYHRACEYAIGKASNGEPFARWTRDVTPFDAVTTKQALSDLPDVADSHVHTCIPKPDHRPSRLEGEFSRTLISMIPRWPPGCGIVRADRMGVLGPRQREYLSMQNQIGRSHRSRGWSRVKPDSRMGCLTTAIRPRDAFQGGALHWEQHRLLTVMEARRIQGIPDEEVIVGIPSAQWKIIGNGVDRSVAFALGLAFGKAWAKSFCDYEGRRDTVRVKDTYPAVMVANFNARGKTQLSCISSRGNERLDRKTVTALGELRSTAPSQPDHASAGEDRLDSRRGMPVSTRSEVLVFSKEKEPCITARESTVKEQMAASAPNHTPTQPSTSVYTIPQTREQPDNLVSPGRKMGNYGLPALVIDMAIEDHDLDSSSSPQHELIDELPSAQPQCDAADASHMPSTLRTGDKADSEECISANHSAAGVPRVTSSIPQPLLQDDQRPSSTQDTVEFCVNSPSSQPSGSWQPDTGSIPEMPGKSETPGRVKSSAGTAVARSQDGVDDGADWNRLAVRQDYEELSDFLSGMISDAEAFTESLDEEFDTGLDDVGNAGTSMPFLMALVKADDDHAMRFGVHPDISGDVPQPVAGTAAAAAAAAAANYNAGVDAQVDELNTGAGMDTQWARIVPEGDPSRSRTESETQRQATSNNMTATPISFPRFSPPRSSYAPSSNPPQHKRGRGPNHKRPGTCLNLSHRNTRASSEADNLLAPSDWAVPVERSIVQPRSPAPPLHPSASHAAPAPPDGAELA